MSHSLKSLLLLAFLVGCQTTGESVGNGPGASGAGEAAQPAGGETRNVAAARAVRFNASEFTGFSPDQVLPILGAPDFVRRDGTAQIWQYRATNCVLDLFLYKAGSETTVKHAELRPRVPGAESLDACYSRMRQERKTNPSG